MRRCWNPQGQMPASRALRSSNIPSRRVSRPEECQDRRQVGLKLRLLLSGSAIVRATAYAGQWSWAWQHVLGTTVGKLLGCRTHHGTTFLFKVLSLAHSASSTPLSLMKSHGLASA